MIIRGWAALHSSSLPMVSQLAYVYTVAIGLHVIFATDSTLLVISGVKGHAISI